MSVFEESAMYEIVEMENGDIALRLSHEPDAEPLVTVRFSEQSGFYLGDARFEVARTMIEAGLDAVVDMRDSEREGVDDEDPDWLVIH